MVERGDFIDSDTLLRLREFVRVMKEHDGRGLPMSQLVGLAGGVKAGAGVTIDLGATRELGEPFVVVQLPAPAARDASCLFESLSAREREVTELVAEGMSNKEIAAVLGISLATVKDHVHNILEKTGLDRRAELIAEHCGRAR